MSRRRTERAEGPLSARELELLGSLARGHSYEQTATKLGISINTVRAHVRTIYKKLGVTSRLEAVLGAMRMGLFSG